MDEKPGQQLGITRSFEENPGKIGREKERHAEAGTTSS